MKNPKTKDNQGLFKGVATAYVILILHVVLIAAVGLLVVFFNGIVNHMLFVFIGAIIIITASGYIFYRRLKRQGQQLGDTLNSPIFNGRSVEVSLLGGLASFRLGESASPPLIENNRVDVHQIEPPRQLEDPETIQIRKLSELAKLYESEMISTEEFNTIKSRIMNA